ncbi:MAG: FecR domain-containing protein, partial [Rhizobiaceae bacterium]
MATVKLTSSDPLSAGVESNIGETALGKIQLVTPEDGRIIIDNPELLFLGDFERQGDDLTLSHGGETQLIIDYFGTGSPASIEAPNGAYLTAQAVTSLAGDPTAGRLAQSGDGGEPVEIGKVVKLDGSATSTSVSGVTNSLEVGAPVFQGDVIETGADSKLGISFLDETVFSMSADARMILDELIYDPADIENSSMAFNLVQGAFVFVTGEIAPSGNMNIETPVATMGIRGTTPKVTINTALGITEFTILPDPGSNEVGNYLIINKATGDIMGSVASSADKWVVTGLSSEAVKINKSGIDLLEDQVALDEITDIFNTAQSQRAQLDGSNNFASVTVDLGLGEGLGDDGGSEADDFLETGAIESKAAKDVNRPPVAGDDFFDVDSSQIISGINLITGAGGGGVDIDPEGFPLGAIFVNDTVAVPATIMLPSGAILVIAANGGVSYDPNGKYDFLGRGDVDEDYFDYTIEDSGALTDMGRVTFTITGLNHQATITDPGTQLTLTEANDTDSAAAIASAIGSIAFNDTDASDRHTPTATLFDIDWQQVNGGVAAVPVNPIGEIKTTDLVLAEATVVDNPVMDRDRDTVNSVPDSVNGTVTWKWTGVESELDFLSALETVTLTYTIRVTDDSADNPFAGANELNFVEQNVSLKITGINDAPIIDAIAALGTGINETTDTSVITEVIPQITFRDVDLNDIGHEATITAVARDGVVDGLTGVDDATVIGFISSLTVTK